MSALKRSVLGVIGSKVTARAHVERVEQISERYRLIDLACDAVRKSVWESAAKVQVDTGGWEMRTYTPIMLDPRAGRVQILAFIHGHSPASRWAAGVEKGAWTHMSGPKASLALGDLNGPAVFFGDETSLAAARSVQLAAVGRASVACVLEVDAIEEAELVISRLGLQDVTLVQKLADGGHLVKLAGHIRARIGATSATHLVLTGGATAIQSVRTSLRWLGDSGVRQRVKAYWAPGKVGLD